MKGTVRVAEDFERDGSLADVLAVGLDRGARLGGLDQHVVGHGAVGPALGARGNARTAG